MKKINTILFTLFLVTSYAQVTITYDTQTEDLSGQTYTMVAPNHQAFDVPFHINNETGLTKQWRVTRYQLNVPTGWSDYLCWGHGTDPFGGTCFSSAQMNANPWTSSASQSLQFDVNDGEFAKLKATIDADDWTSGTAHYRYYIVEGNTNIDSVDLVIQFTASVAPIKEPISVSIVPNPATDFIQISMNGIESASFKMVDALGSTIIKETINSNKKINTSDYKSGLYFIVFDIPGQKPITRKVIIKH
jgi:hypothetical protein